MMFGTESSNVARAAWLSSFYKIRIQHFEVLIFFKMNLDVGNDVLYYCAKSQDEIHYI
jgi:hypothetical protein